MRQGNFLMTNSNTTFIQHSSEPMSSELSFVAKCLATILRAYQRLTSGRPSPCRFYPSCSNYALEAIEAHGAWRGTGLALRRLGRCRPLGPHGVDQVPEPKIARSPQR
jgi:putative membrane protein insertion efficiency factor